MGGKKHFIFFIMYLIMTGLIILGNTDLFFRESIGYLYIDPGNSSLYIEDRGLTIKGQDKEEITYFVLPSYVSISSLSQERSINKVYCEDGTLLSRLDFTSINHVYVATADGNVAEWNIQFLKSGNMHTLDIKLKDTDVDDIDKENYTEASMEVISPEGILKYSEDILIKGRGNSTWLQEKKPYDIKIPEINPLLGLTASSRWSLLANANDDTNVVNKLTMDLARDLGLKYTSDSEWCDLYINNEYRGNYLLCKEPGIGVGRVDIDGFLVECDDREGKKHPSFKVGSGVYKIKDTSEADQFDEKEIRSCLEEIDTELHSSPADMSHIDIESFIKRYLVEEFVYNHDARGLSYFFYKENDNGKLFAGPCWDYDLACGKYGIKDEKYIDYNHTLKQPVETMCDWDYILMDDDVYRQELLRIYTENRHHFQNVINNRINEYEAKLSIADVPDRTIWETSHESRLMYSKTGNKFRYLRFFLNKRLSLLDETAGYKANDPEPDVTAEDDHKIVFNLEDGSSRTMIVKDGAQIDPANLLPYDKERYSGWHYRRETYMFSYFLPVYEDIELDLTEIE